ncbi:MAG: caspase family protein [Armatimonadetes bacterium]|nr:caspase family protein [Armatimonadota bacterium]
MPQPPERHPRTKEFGEGFKPPSLHNVSIGPVKGICVILGIMEAKRTMRTSSRRPTSLFLVATFLVLLVRVSVAQVLSESVWLERTLPFVAGKRWAIVVGANEYEHFPKLRYAVSDARDLAAMLIEHYGFEPATVKLLTDDAGPLHTPTAGHILGEVESILADKRLDQSDLFIFFFSGHGIATPNGDYLLPTDARPASIERVGLPVQELIDRLARAGLQNVLIIADACRSGAESNFGKQLSQLGRETNMAVLLACEPGTRSYEDAALGHGVFTQFLLTNLQNKDLRDPISGALWASSVAEVVREEVEDYSTRHFGIDAQVPEVFTDPRTDVLLGAFIPEEVERSVLEAFLAKAGALAPNYFAAALAEYGETLTEAKQYDVAVEVFRVAERLHVLSDWSAFDYGFALQRLGREVESNQVFLRLMAASPNSFPAHMARLYCKDPSVPAGSVRSSAAWMWNEFRDWSSWETYYLIMDPLASSDEILRLLVEGGQIEGLTDRQLTYLAALVAMHLGDFEKAITLLAEGESLPGAEPSSDAFWFDSLSLHLVLDQRDEALRDCDKLIESSPRPELLAGLYVDKAAVLRLFGRQSETLPLLQKALEAKPDPSTLLRILQTGGGLCAQLTNEIRAASKRYPLSWKARLAGVFADNLWSDFEYFDEKVLEVEAFAGDRVSVRVALGEILAVILLDVPGKDIDTIGGYRQGFYLLFLNLLDVVDDIGNDVTAWTRLFEWGLGAGRSDQVDAVFDKFSKHIVGDGKVRSEMAPVLALLFANAGQGK